MDWAAAEGVVTGYVNGSSKAFKPNANVTRQDLMVILARYAKADGGSDAWRALGGAGQVSAYAADAIAWGVDNGIIGSNGNLNPKGNATRAEAAKMILMALDASNTVQIPSPRRGSHLQRRGADRRSRECGLHALRRRYRN